jgi:thiamine pyrophosphate-dependent acetolactate synthase large subunit-like protein
MRRYECLEWLASEIGDDGLVVANSGSSSRQWAHLRPSDGNLLSAGVGLVLPISLGLALALPHRRVLALEGDGSALMSASALAVLGTARPGNLLVVAFDNEAYMEGAKWPTATARGVDLAGMAAAAGVAQARVVRSLAELREAVAAHDRSAGAGYVVAKIDAQEDPVPSDPRDMRRQSTTSRTTSRRARGSRCCGRRAPRAPVARRPWRRRTTSPARCWRGCAGRGSTAW